MSLWAIRSRDGSMLKPEKTPSGGGEVVAWIDGAWRPVNTSVGRLMGLPPASPDELRSAGVPELDEH